MRVVVVCAVLAAAVISSVAASASAQGLGSTLARPTASPTVGWEPDTTGAEPPSFGALYGSGWAGWSAGLGIGAAVGLVGGLIATATCEHDGGWTCPLLVVGSGVSGGLALGGLIGAGVGVWRAGDEHAGGGEGWLALLGSFLVPAITVGLAGLVALSLDDAGVTGAVVGGATFVSVVLTPQLGAALFYELSRSF